MFLIIFAYSILTVLSMFTIKIPIETIIWSMIVTAILCMSMLLNLQVLFNGAIFELYPDDWILGTILMFADVM